MLPQVATFLVRSHIPCCHLWQQNSLFFYKRKEYGISLFEAGLCPFRLYWIDRLFFLEILEKFSPAYNNMKKEYESKEIENKNKRKRNMESRKHIYATQQ
jgi:hypothetical protein